jgi:hypothetical protein
MSFKEEVVKYNVVLDVGGTELKAVGQVGDLMNVTSEDSEPEEVIITKVPKYLKKHTVVENDEPQVREGFTIEGEDLNLDGTAADIQSRSTSQSDQSGHPRSNEVIALYLISNLYATPEDEKRSQKAENIINLKYRLNFSDATGSSSSSRQDENKWISLEGPKVLVLRDLPFLDKAQSSGRVPSQIEIKYGSFKDIVVLAVAAIKKKQK